MMLTTKEIVKLNIHKDLSTTKQVAALCHDGILYSYRDNSPFSSWMIPVQSFARFLHYHPDYLSAYLEKYKTSDNYGDDSMNQIVKIINKALAKDQSYNDSYYTVAQLSDIFALPENQIRILFAPREKIKRLIMRAVPSDLHRIPIEHILNVLDEHPERVTKLKERQCMLFSKGDIQEGNVRHILMLYAYHTIYDNKQKRQS